MTCEYQPPRVSGDVRYTKRKCTTHEIEFLDDWGCPVGALMKERRQVMETTVDYSTYTHDELRAIIAAYREDLIKAEAKIAHLGDVITKLKRLVPDVEENNDD